MTGVGVGANTRESVRRSVFGEGRDQQAMIAATRPKTTASELAASVAAPDLPEPALGAELDPDDEPELVPETGSPPMTPEFAGSA